MDLRQVRYFVAACEEGSITAAAKRMNCTPPGISQQMSALELRHDISLLERSSRGVTPTAAGERLYKKCLGILRAVSEAEGEIASLRHEVTGKVAVGLIPALSKAILPKLLADYTHKYPAVDIHVVEAYAGTLTQSLLKGDLDFAVGPLPPDETGLSFEKIAEQPMGLLSGKILGLEQMKPIRLDAIHPLRLVMPSPQHSLRPTLENLIRLGDIKVEKSMSIDGLTGTLEFISQTEWVSIIPSALCLNQLNDSRMTVNPIVFPDLKFEIALIQLARQSLSRPAQLLVDILKSELEGADANWQTQLDA